MNIMLLISRNRHKNQFIGKKVRAAQLELRDELQRISGGY